MNKNGLFLIKSPLQLLNAIEASYHFGIESSTLLVQFEDNKNKNLMEALIQFKQWNDIITIEGGIMGTMMNELWTLRKMVSKNEHYDYIFIGDFRATNYLVFANNLRHREVFLLDDGTALYYIQDEYLRHARPFSNGRKIDIARKLLASFLQLKVRMDLNLRLNLFTSLQITPFSGQKKEINTYEFTRNLREKSSRKIDDNLIFFIGAKYPEAGWMSEEDYLVTLKKIKERYFDKRVVYLPHRGEKDQKLKKITNDIGFELRSLDKIIEIALLDIEILPSEIAGFTSTALVNLLKIYPDISIISYRIPDYLFQSDWKTTSSLFYKNFAEREHINVIPL